MTVQNVYHISNHGTMYFPGAAQGMQSGDYNSMYMSLSHQRNGPDYENLYNNSAGYEDIENDSEVSHL